MEKIQSVTLFFDDGGKATFTGPAVIFEESKKVVGITFGPPSPMPEGCEWGKLDTRKNHEEEHSQ